MTREDFYKKILELRINDRFFDAPGKEEHYSFEFLKMVAKPGGWRVVFIERGEESPHFDKFFKDENEAWDCMFEKLKSSKPLPPIKG